MMTNNTNALVHFYMEEYIMSTPKIFESEYRFCKILWKNEPIKSGELAKICFEELGWKKTTTYTVIKRLEERGVLANENTVVRSLVKEDEAQVAEIDELLDSKFGGSCPDFLAAFTRSRKFNEEDLDKMMKMIEEIRNREA